MFRFMFKRRFNWFDCGAVWLVTHFIATSETTAQTVLAWALVLPIVIISNNCERWVKTE